MNFRQLLLPLAITAVCMQPLHAAPADDEDEDFVVPGYYRQTPNTLRFGYRLTQGAKVHFGNLGTVPAMHSIAAASAGEVDRTYDNGFVNKDAPRVDELYGTPANPTTEGQSVQSTVVLGNGRYQVFSTTLIGGTLTTQQLRDGLSYSAGLSRSWGFSDPATQVAPGGGGIIMSQYSAVSEGGAYDSKSGYSSGVELQVARHIGKLGKNVEVSLVGGLALSNITNHKSGNVTSTLHTLRDTFSLNGLAVPGSATGYSAPSSATLVIGDLSVPNGLETTTVISAVPGAHEEADTPGGANVSGNWRIDGAYYVMRIGPELRAMFGENFGITAGLGVSGAFVGTNYSVEETLNVTGISNTISTTAQSAQSKFMPGYYASMNAEYTVSERTGFFAGLSYEKYGDYSQSVGERTAKIDLGSTVGIRGGISIKF